MMDQGCTNAKEIQKQQATKNKNEKSLTEVKQLIVSMNSKLHT